MIEEFLTSALVIDDDPNEIKDLLQYLDDKDIWAKHYTPDELEKKKKAFNNRKLIFLDLYLDNSKKSVENIAIIRKYFKNIIGNDFGTYGIVLWTKHSNHFDEFCEKIFQKNNPFTLPLFALSLDKTKYIAKNNYEGILEELEQKLSEDISSSFFIEWNKSVKKGSDNTITSVYNLFDTNQTKDRDLEYIFSSLACNYTGINLKNADPADLQKDLIKSLMDPLQFEVSNNYKPISKLFGDLSKMQYKGTAEEKIAVYSKLNAVLLLDSHTLSQNTVLPGNIYEILDNNSPIFINEFLDKKDKIIDLNGHIDLKNLNKRRICIELTPPCDYAQNKKQLYSRVVGGIQMDYNKKVMEHFKTENFYNHLWPLQIEGYEKPQVMIFDFYRFQTVKEDVLKNSESFKLIMKAKEKLFADVLQKLSSHTARLGIGILYA